MRSDSSSSRRKGSVETRGEFEIYISDVVVHPRYTVRTSSQSSISLLKFLVFFSWILSVERECVCVCGDWGDGFWEWKSVENVVFFWKRRDFESSSNWVCERVHQLDFRNCGLRFLCLCVCTKSPKPHPQHDILIEKFHITSRFPWSNSHSNNKYNSTQKSNSSTTGIPDKS